MIKAALSDLNNSHSCEPAPGQHAGQRKYGWQRCRYPSREWMSKQNLLDAEVQSNSKKPLLLPEGEMENSLREYACEKFDRDFPHPSEMNKSVRSSAHLFPFFSKKCASISSAPSSEPHVHTPFARAVAPTRPNSPARALVPIAPAPKGPGSTGLLEPKYGCGGLLTVWGYPILGIG